MERDEVPASHLHVIKGLVGPFFDRRIALVTTPSEASNTTGKGKRETPVRAGGHPPQSVEALQWLNRHGRRALAGAH
jgi:hypothetical protein